ncbi:MAG: BamA/TamA family outer membrane protein, partial [Pseudomonadota bacterium]|nr:BamA/TamA family outer membrane protein [Pseudomonadota bacterium]
PLVVLDEFGMRGHVFTDAGTIGDVDDEDPNIEDNETLRLSTGFGLSWKSPLGPLRIDFGFPILKEEFDDTETFRFGFTSRF